MISYSFVAFTIPKLEPESHVSYKWGD